MSVNNAEGFDPEKIDRLKSKVTLIGAFINLFLSIIKIGFGLLGQSAALIADGIHSLSDLFSDFFVLIAVKLGSREADWDHPYGHRRFETMATVILGIALIAVAGGIAWDAVEKIRHPEKLLTPTPETMGIATLSILANEWLFQYTKRIARQTRSKLLLANAWHHRSDALSSVIVLIGLAAVFYGYTLADVIAALIVALMIAKIGFDLAAESLKELVDTSLPADIVQEIRQSILSTEGVEGIHFVRTRQMGEDAFVDAHIVVNPRISVSEGHMIGDQVRDKLKAEFDDIMDVLVHVDPEDDQYKTKNGETLSRQHLYDILQRYFGTLNKYIEGLNIHYLNGLIELEITMSDKIFTDKMTLPQIKKRAERITREQSAISKVSVLIKT